jgi:hypothetical protein
MKEEEEENDALNSGRGRISEWECQLPASAVEHGICFARRLLRFPVILHFDKNHHIVPIRLKMEEIRAARGPLSSTRVKTPSN